MTKQILTTTVLLLSLFTYAEAQNRSASEALAGLRQIGITVKYDNAEGLEPAMQPTILQMLLDRAKDQLLQAGVPVLESTNEVDTVSRPRLVFSVTANKPSDTAPTIRVQSSLFERVRLWRDPAKELELATWVQDGIGIAQKLTPELLLQVFDGQLNEFVKDYRAANPNPTAVGERTSNSSAQAEDDANALQGLNGVKLFVSFRPDPLADAAERAELQKKLQGEAEKKLTEAGIPLLKWAGESERAGSPLLYVLITASRPTFKTYAPPIDVESNFWQQVRPIRDPKKQTYAVTWESHDSGDFGKTNDGASAITHDAVLDVLNHQLKEFIDAYKAANPKWSAAATNTKAQ